MLWPIAASTPPQAHPPRAAHLVSIILCGHGGPLPRPVTGGEVRPHHTQHLVAAHGSRDLLLLQEVGQQHAAEETVHAAISLLEKTGDTIPNYQCYLLVHDTLRQCIGLISVEQLFTDMCNSHGDTPSHTVNKNQLQTRKAYNCICIR